MLRLAGALEDASEHPIAQAGRRRRRRRGRRCPRSTDFANVEGLGVQGVVDGHAVVVGRRAAAGRLAQHLPAELERAPPPPRPPAGPRSRSAGTAGRAALLVVADTVKPTSAAAVRQLRDLGLRRSC